VFVWGENEGLAAKLLKAVEVPEDWRQQNQRQQDEFADAGDHAWIALLNPPVDAIEILRNALRLIYRRATAERGIGRWGFKEIRHGADIASILLDCFPDGRVVMLVRHPRSCLASIAGTGWLDAWGEAVRPAEHWTQNAKSFLALTDPRALLLRLEDFADGPDDATHRLGAHLGIAPARFSVDVLANVLRGTQALPRFGPDEAKLLDNAELKAAARQLGYRDV
jgi:hypothetical protein